MLPTDTNLINRLTPFGHWLYARLISVGVIVAIALTIMLFLAFESKDIRDWLGALGGWVAAAGALGVGLPTLRFLRDQIKLQLIENRIITNEEMQSVLDKIRDCMADHLKEQFILDHDQNEPLYVFLAIQDQSLRKFSITLKTAESIQIRNSIHPIVVMDEILMRHYGPNTDELDLDIQSSEKIAREFTRKLITLTNNESRRLRAESKRLTKWKHDRLLS